MYARQLSTPGIVSRQSVERLSLTEACASIAQQLCREPGVPIKSTPRRFFQHHRPQHDRPGHYVIGVISTIVLQARRPVGRLGARSLGRPARPVATSSPCDVAHKMDHRWRRRIGACQSSADPVSFKPEAKRLNSVGRSAFRRRS